MIRGMYRSAAGMLPRVKQQEAAANNIANATTSGFKKDIVFSRELSRAQQRTSGSTTQNNWQQTLDNRVVVDQSFGVFDKTDNPLDMAIDGDGFFTLLTPEGDTILTRNGGFVVDSEGFLAFPGGLRLVGDGGPIQVGNGAVTIADNGQVQADGVTVGTVTPKTIENLDSLERLGGSLFAAPQNEELIDPLQFSIRQGYKETSNVDVVTEMVDMIMAYRTYEANAKALQTQESTLDHLLGGVAR